MTQYIFIVHLGLCRLDAPMKKITKPTTEVFDTNKRNYREEFEESWVCTIQLIWCYIRYILNEFLIFQSSVLREVETVISQAEVYKMQKAFMEIKRLNKADLTSFFEKFPFMEDFDTVSKLYLSFMRHWYF